MRIEGLSEGIRSGQFPVKVQPLWYNGYGYACSVFYGDIFLYVPAVLRILGLSLQNAYKIFILMCNVFTVIASAYSFNGIFKNKKIAFIGTTFYVLATYRLTNIYIRAAVGEYTAMIFLPLIAYSLYLLLRNERKNGERGLNKGAFLLAISMTGILQSHLLSFEINVLIMGVICLIFLKKVLNKNVIINFIKAIGLTILFNIGFLVPFIDYMVTGKFNVNAINGGPRVEQTIQDSGAFFSQLFGLFYHANGTNLLREAGTNGEMPIGIGLGLGISLIVVLYLELKMRREAKQNTEWKIIRAATLVGILSLFLSSYHFPWDFIRELGKLPRYLVINIQFPWRFCTVATIALSVLWCALIKIMIEKKEEVNELHLKIMILAAVAISVVSTIFLLEDILATGTTIRVRERVEIDTMVKSGEEYIPINTNIQNFSEENLVKEEGLIISDVIENGINIKFFCTNTIDLQKILELPRLFYSGYQADYVKKNQEKGTFDTYAGNNNVVRIIIPPNFEGTIELKFKEPWYWRMCEVISFFSFIVFVLKYKKDNINDEELL